MRTSIVKVISGGQTGADRGGLDAAIDLRVPHGGWCPKDRRAEDGQIPIRYGLVETASRNYLVRTEQNVIDSHMTVVFTFGRPVGGSKKTVELARKHERPCIVIDLDETDDEKLAGRILESLSPGGLQMPGTGVQPSPVLNVAGSRESKAPGIQDRVRSIMRLVLDWPGYMPCAE